jgi:hypothetical protein
VRAGGAHGVRAAGAAARAAVAARAVGEQAIVRSQGQRVGMAVAEMRQPCATARTRKKGKKQKWCSTEHARPCCPDSTRSFVSSSFHTHAQFETHKPPWRPLWCVAQDYRARIARGDGGYGRGCTPLLCPPLQVAPARLLSPPRPSAAQGQCAPPRRLAGARRAHIALADHAAGRT